MGLISHAAAVGLGYALARPEGRRQLVKLRDQVRRLLQHPQVARLQERGQELAAQQVSAATEVVKQKLGREDTHEAPISPADAVPTLAPTGPRHAADVDPPHPVAPNGVSGFGGPTVEEDSRAASMGVAPLPPGTTPPAPTSPPTPYSEDTPDGPTTDS